MIVYNLEFNKLLKEVDLYFNEISSMYYDIRKRGKFENWYQFKDPLDVKRVIIDLLKDCHNNVLEKLSTHDDNTSWGTSGYSSLSTMGIESRFRYNLYGNSARKFYHEKYGKTRNGTIIHKLRNYGDVTITFELSGNF